MTDPYRILVLCTGNSARSILAEYLLRAKGRGGFEVRSAGAKPTGCVNPRAIRVLRERHGLDASGARSKSWDEFRAASFDVVITVCDHARELCPVWPGAPILAHWGSPDPAAAEGTDEEKRGAFERVAAQIAARADLLAALTDAQRREPAAVRGIGAQFSIEPAVAR